MNKLEGTPGMPDPIKYYGTFSKEERLNRLEKFLNDVAEHCKLNPCTAIEQALKELDK